MRSDTVHIPSQGTACRRVHRGRIATTVALTALAVLIAVGSTFPATAGAVTLAEKKAQAARLNAEVTKLDTAYDHLQERYRGAMFRLDQLNERVDDLTVDLRHTEANLEVAQDRLTERAVAVYENGASNSRLVNLAQAGSFSRFVDRMEAIQRLGQQDTDILERIRVLRERVVTKRAQLKEAQGEQRQLVRQARSDRDEMKGKLDQRTRLLNSVNAEVRQMAEAQRRAELAAAQARARASARSVTTDSGGGAAPTGTTDAGTALGGGAPAPPASGSAASAASVAMRYLGVPYVWGGASPSGFDCSGLVMYSFAQVGISLPHSSYALWNSGPHVDRSALQSGDLVFFSGLGHVGIYVGGGSFVHAPHSGDVVKVSSLYDSYGTSAYVGAVRITG